MTQLSLKEVLKERVTIAQNYVHSEMNQIHFQDTFKPINWKELDDTQRKSVLKSHMFLDQKRDGKMK